VFLTACEKPETTGNGGASGSTTTGGGEKTDGQAAAPSTLRGKIDIQGSSTVEPISNQAKEKFNVNFPDVQVTVGRQGTGNGFSVFSKRESDISDASRPIKKKELDDCAKNGVNFIELPVAYDGLTIVVNPKNTFVKELTLDQIRKIFRDGGASTWKEVDESWPDKPIMLYIPGTGSGTFDYFLEVVGKEGDSEVPLKTSGETVSPSEDDNLLVHGVAGDEFAIGYFGYAYYEANKDQLKAVPIVNPETSTAVTPSRETIESGEYAPFSRPLFIYVNAESLDSKNEVLEFVEFYVENASEIVNAARYVPLPEAIYQRVREHLDERLTGTHYIMEDGSTRSGPLGDVYQRENLPK
jgi:phosphate transport system substrate-binding protein